MKLREAEKVHIIRILQQKQFNRTWAAKELGIGLRTLQRKLKLYEKQGIEVPMYSKQASTKE